MALQKFISEVTFLHETNAGEVFMTKLEEYKRCAKLFDGDKYLNEIKNIEDNLKFLLHAILEEAYYHIIKFVELYKLSSKNKCAIASWRLANLYSDPLTFQFNSKDTIYYSCLYHKNKNDLHMFIKTSNIFNNSNLLKMFMNIFCDSFSENKNLYYQRNAQQIIIEQLQKQVIELQEHVTELEYAPNGAKYNECKEHFNSLIKENSNQI